MYGQGVEGLPKNIELMRLLERLETLRIGEDGNPNPNPAVFRKKKNVSKGKTEEVGTAHGNLSEEKPSVVNEGEEKSTVVKESQREPSEKGHEEPSQVNENQEKSTEVNGGQNSGGEREVEEDMFLEETKVLYGHRDHVSSLLVVGNMLVTASFDKTINCWDLELAAPQ